MLPTGITAAQATSISALLPQILGRSLMVSQEYFNLVQMLVSQDPIKLAFYFDMEPDKLLKVREDGIAVVNVSGRLMKGMWYDDYADIGYAFDEALDDPMVKSVIFDINSPGGSVAGCFELCEHIIERREEKPVWAYSSDQATSAAYAIAASASRFHVGRSCITGSIGVIAMHTDFSKMDDRIGIETTEVVSGKHKNDLSSSKPLNKDGLSTLQKMVDLDFNVFAEHVETGRGSITVEEIRNLQAQVFFGEEALEIGLADAQSTFDEMVTELTKQGGASATTRVPARNAATDNPEADASLGGKDMDPETMDDNVVQIAEARTEGREQGINEGKEQEKARITLVSELCVLAGFPEMITEFVKSGASGDDARAKLIERRAAATDSAGSVDPHAATHANDDVKMPSLTPDSVYSRWKNRTSAARTH